MEQYYKVEFSGELLEGYSIDQVKQNLAKAFSVELNQVSGLFSGKPVVMKKKLNRSSAIQYQKKMHALGVNARIIPLQQASINGDKVTIDGLEDNSAKPDPIGIPTIAEVPRQQKATGIASNTMTCPKCETHQPKADACSKCGIYIDKFLKRHEEKTVPARVKANREQANKEKIRHFVNNECEASSQSNWSLFSLLGTLINTCLVIYILGVHFYFPGVTEWHIDRTYTPYFKQSLSDMCNHDTECMAVVASNASDCLINSGANDLVEESQWEQHMEGVMKKLSACFIDENGQPYFSDEIMYIALFSMYQPDLEDLNLDEYDLGELNKEIME